MFEVFTDRARRVVVLAQEEARMLNHNYIGTEHLLLGLIHEGEGVAATALESLGISLQDVRQNVEEMIGRGQHELSGHIPFTPRTKKVLELSLRESQQLGHDYIGTEHILLGLIREGEGVAAQVLVKMGADLNRVRQQVLQLLGGRGHEELGESEAGGTRVAGAVRQSPAGPQVVGTPLQPAGILSRLADIVERLDAIERHLGIGPRRPEEPQQPEEPGEAGPAAG
jgi:ATP-dependent Clp protease ATP-binding subunit ClpC